MANVIIKPEHQAAPKTPFVSVKERLEFEEARRQSHLKVRRGDFGDEMDLPDYNDPRIQAELVAFQRNDPMSKSPEQTVEGQLAIFEKNYHDERTKAQRWAGREAWKEHEAERLVNILTPGEFIRRLAKAGVSADQDNPVVDEFIREMNKQHPDKSYEVIGTGGSRIWLNNFSRVGRIGVNAWIKPPLGHEAFDKRVFIARTLTTLQYECGPEWTVMRFNQYDVPTNEKYRGWRTALLALIKHEIITEEEAHRAFPLSNTPASVPYRRMLREIRQTKMEASLYGGK